MQNQLIIPENEKDLEFLKDLMVRLGYSTRELTREEMEDMGLLSAMVSEKWADYVAEKKFRKNLGKK